MLFRTWKPLYGLASGYWQDGLDGMLGCEAP